MRIDLHNSTMDKTLFVNFYSKNVQYFELPEANNVESFPYFNETKIQELQTKLKEKNLDDYETFFNNLSYSTRHATAQHISIMCRKLVKLLTPTSVNILYIPPYLSFSDLMVIMIAYHYFLNKYIHFIARSPRDIESYFKNTKSTLVAKENTNLIMIQNRFFQNVATSNLENFKPNEHQSKITLRFCCLYCTAFEESQVVQNLNSECSFVIGTKIERSINKLNNELVPIITYYDTNDVSDILNDLRMNHGINYTLQDILHVSEQNFISGYVNNDTSILEEMFVKSFGCTQSEATFVNTLITSSKSFKSYKYSQIYVKDTHIFLYNIMHLIEFVITHMSPTDKKSIHTDTHSSLISIHVQWLKFSKEHVHHFDSSQQVVRHHRHYTIKN